MFSGGNHACFVGQLAVANGYDRKNPPKKDSDWGYPIVISADDYLEDEIGLNSNNIYELMDINDDDETYPSLKEKVKAWRPVMKKLGYRLVVK